MARLPPENSFQIQLDLTVSHIELVEMQKHYKEKRPRFDDE
jgi:hypothetical protein